MEDESRNPYTPEEFVKMFAEKQLDLHQAKNLAIVIRDIFF